MENMESLHFDCDESISNSNDQYDTELDASLSADIPVKSVASNDKEFVNTQSHPTESINSNGKLLVKPERMGVSIAFGNGYQTIKRNTTSINSNNLIDFLPTQDTHDNFDDLAKSLEFSLVKEETELFKNKSQSFIAANSNSDSQSYENDIDEYQNGQNITVRSSNQKVDNLKYNMDTNPLTESTASVQVSNNVEVERVTKTLFSQYDELLKTSVQKVQDYEKQTKINLINWSEFENSIDDFQSEAFLNNMDLNTILSKRASSDGVYGKQLTHQVNASNKWFTNEALSPKSVESHDSFWDEIIDEIEHKSPVIKKLVKFEDQIHAKLRSEIDGKWTKRFVSKRTKPKILNSLHRERLDVLIHFLHKDSQSWNVIKSAYINLAFRLRLNYDTVSQWLNLMDVLKVSANSIQESIEPQCQAFADFIASRNDENSIDESIQTCVKIYAPKHFVVFSNIINALFIPSIKHQYDAYDGQQTEVSMITKQIKYSNSHSDSHSDSMDGETAVNKLVKRALKRREKMHDKGQIKFESYVKGGNQSISETESRTKTQDIASSFDMELEHIDELKQHLNDAGTRLNEPMWKIHDTYHLIDNEIDEKVNEALVYFGNNADHNPLIKTNVKIFPKFLNELLTLIRSSNYAKRRTNCVVNALLPDFMSSEISSANIMMISIQTFINKQLSQLNSMDVISSQLSAMIQEMNAKKEKVDSLDVCHETLSDMCSDTNDLIDDEIPEVNRLTDSQVICKSTMLAIGLDFVKQSDAMSAFQFPMHGMANQGNLFLEFLDQIGDNTYALEDNAMTRPMTEPLPPTILEMKNAQLVANMMVQGMQPRQVVAILTEQKWLYIFEHVDNIIESNNTNEFEIQSQMKQKSQTKKKVKFDMKQGQYKTEKQEQLEARYEIKNRLSLQQHEQFQVEENDEYHFQDAESEQCTLAINLNRLSSVHVNIQQKIIIFATDHEIISFGAENEQTLQQWRKQLQRLCIHASTDSIEPTQD